MHIIISSVNISFTSIGISSFYCKIITQIYNTSLVIVIQNTTVSVGEVVGGGSTIKSKVLENIFYEIKQTKVKCIFIYLGRYSLGLT